jgi:hypothetical protein
LLIAVDLFPVVVAEADGIVRGGRSQVRFNTRVQPVADLVPADHFYRHLGVKLDLGYICDLVRTSTW